MMLNILSKFKTKRTDAQLAELPEKPKFILIETTSRCNLRCIQCASLNPGYRKADLPIELFNKIIPALQKYRPAVALSGHGETLLHPQFFEMLEKVTELGCPVCFQTNGTLLTQENIDRIVKAGVTSITISMDGATPETYESIRRGARYERVLKNITNLNESKKRADTGCPSLAIEFVAMRRNIHELPDLVKKAAELGAVSLIIAELVEYDLTRGESLAHDELLARWIEKAEAEAQKTGIILQLPPHVPGRKNQENSCAPKDNLPPTKCRDPWELTFIKLTGKVSPCCSARRFSCGDLNEQNLEDIWHGENYRALRRAMLAGSPPEMCKKCHLYE